MKKNPEGFLMKIVKCLREKVSKYLSSFFICLYVYENAMHRIQRFVIHSACRPGNRSIQILFKSIFYIVSH